MSGGLTDQELAELEQTLREDRDTVLEDWEVEHALALIAEIRRGRAAGCGGIGCKVVPQTQPDECFTFSSYGGMPTLLPYDRIHVYRPAKKGAEE